MEQQGIRIGIVGAGYWGANLIRVCAELGVLDSICEVDEIAVGSVKRSHPRVEVVSHLDALLARPIDAVVIATPAHMHTTMCLAAIRAGKHVFVEKPLALTVEEGERIAKAAEGAKLIAFVGHLLLYHPAVQKLRSLVVEKVVGRVWHVRSRRLSLGKLRNHESVWWSFAPHDIALLLAIMGEEPRSAVAAQTACGRSPLSDVAYADFEFSSGRSGHVETCWLDPEKSARLDVFGDKGVLTLSDSRGGSSLSLRAFSITTDGRGLPMVSRGDEKQIEFENCEPLKAEMLAFIDSVRTGKPTQTSARHGVAVLRVLSMADEALTNANVVRELA